MTLTHSPMSTAVPAITAPHAPSNAVAVHVLELGDGRAADPSRGGAKAANLATAVGAGLPVLPGFVLTTDGTAAFIDGEGSVELFSELSTALGHAWELLSAHGRHSLVVRSSSTVEDLGTTSMAGVFESVLDVDGWDEFTAAVRTVAASGRDVPGLERAPMAILVQPMLRPRLGGVLFGADPVTNRRDRLVVAAVEGGPDRLVGGRLDGAHYTLTTSGRVVESSGSLGALRRRDLHALANLARRAAELFGGPQDIEWAIDHDGTVWLLQSRAITTLGPDPATAAGPLFGAGPIAETFPRPLEVLEQDLWLDPLRDGLRAALELTGSAAPRLLRTSPIVIGVGGRLAADLDLLGMAPRRRTLWRRLDPRPPARRLGAAWRVGRLRAAFPLLADDIIGDLDEVLLAVDSLDQLDDLQLVGLIERAQPALRTAHTYEVLAGALWGAAGPAPSTTGSVSGAGIALTALAAGRSANLADAEIIATTPGVLALVPPRIGEPPTLPNVPLRLSTLSIGSNPDAAVRTTVGTASDRAIQREALRMRVRWLHELMARSAWELAGRLVDRHAIDDRNDIVHLRLSELRAMVAGHGAPVELVGRRHVPVVDELSAAFRLTSDGTPVPVIVERSTANGAGGGRGSGRVVHAPSPPGDGDVLVVATLDPDLAPLLPRLGGLVAETGSVLSHLAILAREFGVPTVVGVADARRRFLPGSYVTVDGASGDVVATPEPDDALPLEVAA